MATTATVGDVFSSDARNLALDAAGKSFVGWAFFRHLLSDISPLGVSQELKRAGSVIDAALDFDGKAAESRLLEIDASPEAETPNPFSIENQESLRSIVRSVLSSALKQIGGSMPPEWDGSRVQVTQAAAAEAALLKRIDEEYPRRRVDFESQAKARRRASVGAVPSEAQTSSTKQGKGKRRQPGSPRGKRLVLIGMLSKHQGYDDGFCSNADPIGNNELARKAKVSKRAASEFFDAYFGGHDAYKSACQDPRRLGASLKMMNGDARPREFRIEYREGCSVVPLFRAKSGTPDDSGNACNPL